jgi:hypothetical protein
MKLAEKGLHSASVAPRDFWNIGAY